MALGMVLCRYGQGCFSTSAGASSINTRLSMPIDQNLFKFGFYYCIDACSFFQLYRKYNSDRVYWLFPSCSVYWSSRMTIHAITGFMMFSNHHSNFTWRMAYNIMRRQSAIWSSISPQNVVLTLMLIIIIGQGPDIYCPTFYNAISLHMISD